MKGTQRVETMGKKWMLHHFEGICFEKESFKNKGNEKRDYRKRKSVTAKSPDMNRDICTYISVRNVKQQIFI